MKNGFFAKGEATPFRLLMVAATVELIVTAVFVILFAVLMLTVSSTLGFASVFATVSLAMGCLAASYAIAKYTGEKGWLYGLLVGGVTFLIVLSVALLMNHGSLTMTTPFRFLILVLSSLIGGVIGVNRAHHRTYL